MARSHIGVPNLFQVMRYDSVKGRYALETRDLNPAAAGWRPTRRGTSMEAISSRALMTARAYLRQPRKRMGKLPLLVSSAKCDATGGTGGVERRPGRQSRGPKRRELDAPWDTRQHPPAG
jgi:hypothetical protein